MGLSASAAMQQAQRLSLPASESQAPPEAGHGRGTFITSGRREELARIPLIGVNAGCIPGTAPGCSAKELERAARDIVRSRMALARQKLKKPH